MTKYCKVMFGTTSGAKSDFEYKIDEVTEAKIWNPNATDPSEMGGLNYSTYDMVFRWLIRGDIIYDVTVPEDAESICFNNHQSTPGGVFRANKIIVSNPRPVTDELALELYRMSNLPEKSYYKALAGAAIRGYRNTCIELIKDRINKDNIDLVLSEINDFVKPENHSHINEKTAKVYYEVMEYLNEIKSDLLISRFISKDPYIKQITNDKIINLTGESGSGKSYYTNKYLTDDNYIVIDTDIVFGTQSSDNKESLEIRELFKTKNKDDLIYNFDKCYQEILDYFKDTNKTIVIDSAQYRNIKDINVLKGKIIIMRTDIETCYQRCIDRFTSKNKNIDDLEKFKERKKGMFNWYHSINDLLEKIDKD